MCVVRGNPDIILVIYVFLVEMYIIYIYGTMVHMSKYDGCILQNDVCQPEYYRDYGCLLVYPNSLASIYSTIKRPYI